MLNLLIVRINASNKQSGDDDEIKIESNTFTMSRIPVPPRIEREERELADLLRGLRSIQRLSSDHIILKSKNYKAVLKKTNV